MEAFFIEATEFTPRIAMNPDNKLFEISGVSRPENVSAFYTQVIEWLKGFKTLELDNLNSSYREGPYRIIFRLSYFNSSSAKMILQLLETIKEASDNGVEMNIEWYYEEGDEQVLEDGEDLSETIELPFRFIEIVD
ncbi:MAG: DUF1987 domain-containing protein [Bacteroidota bacterium]